MTYYSSAKMKKYMKNMSQMSFSAKMKIIFVQIFPTKEQLLEHSITSITKDEFRPTPGKFETIEKSQMSMDHPRTPKLVKTTKLLP